MCLALPHRITRILDSRRALAEGPDGERTISTDLVGELAPGAYVIVVYGAAIREVAPDEAAEILGLVAELTAQDPPLTQ
ncbi:MAG: HypC/HybG/HupF family hydrogenase formation chaperone [Armatimonadetes bacterium]|nr:HypC/HybG/HupF family hydrogenase formation chaperone [Armatimonadota bacterium]